MLSPAQLTMLKDCADALRPKGKPMPVTEFELTNVHPADELAAVREQIAKLTKQADKLRDALLAEGADLHGDQYDAVITPGVRETLDRKALEEAFGEAAVAPYVKKTRYQIVKLQEH